MRSETVRALNRVNRRFYAAHAEAFDRRRDHDWPGFGRILSQLPGAPRAVLDAGCGNARFGAFLARHVPSARYLGFDASAALLRRAAARSDLPARASFVRGDLVEAPAGIPGGPFDLVVLLGVLHHVPGAATRRQLVRALAERLAPGGHLALSAWRFADFERFGGLRIPQPPAEMQDWDPGDALLSFEGDDRTPRYCHALCDEELDALEPGVAGRWIARFRSDGREGTLNEYRLWRRE